MIAVPALSPCSSYAMVSTSVCTVRVCELVAVCAVARVAAPARVDARPAAPVDSRNCRRVVGGMHPPWSALIALRALLGREAPRRLRIARQSARLLFRSIIPLRPMCHRRDEILGIFDDGFVIEMLAIRAQRESFDNVLGGARRQIERIAFGMRHETYGVDDERIAVPASDRMTKQRGFQVCRMARLIEMNDALDAHIVERQCHLGIVDV